MELKCRWSTWCYSCWLRSNCTFMELKSKEFSLNLIGFKGSNCTFMELKFGSLTDDELINSF